MSTYTFTMETLAQVWELKSQASGSIELKIVNANHEGLAECADFLRQHGSILKSLSVKLLFPQRPFHHDWQALDFAKICPHLEQLSLRHIDVNASVLQHPHLKILHCESTWIHSNARIDLSNSLEKVQLSAVNWAGIKQLDLRQHLRLRIFSYDLDEDDTEAYPETFNVEACQHLEELSLNISGNWNLNLVGDFPRLHLLGASSGRYGHHLINLAAVGNKSHANLLTLRDGLGEFHKQVFAFVGTFKHLNLAKAQQSLELLGGRLAGSLSDPALNVLVISQSDIANFDETPYSNVEIYSESDFRDAIMGWY